MTTRLVPLDGATKLQYQTLSGQRHEFPKGRDGTVRVHDEQIARALVREGLAVRAAATGPVAHLPGWRCPDCNRRNYFKTCGCCGSPDGERE